ncbi:MAG: DUF1404 family protein [Chloroflexi bacterium]|nr:DUF1404 family protein [Chloroflexota bacterium]
MLKKLGKADILFALVLFAFAVRFPVIDELSEANLAFHMTVQHFLVILPGAILGAQLVRLGGPGKGVSIALAVVVVALIGIWHIPRFWDLAYSNDTTHILEHLSLFIAGIIIWISRASLGRPLKWWFLVIYLIFGSILAASTIGGRQIYQSSPPAQHRELASYMVMTMPLIFFAVAFAPSYLPQVTDFWTKRKLSIWVSGLLILVLLIGLVL